LADSNIGTIGGEAVELVGQFETYDDLVERVRERAASLGLPYRVIEELTGLGEGNASNYPSDLRSKQLTIGSLLAGGSAGEVAGQAGRPVRRLRLIVALRLPRPIVALGLPARKRYLSELLDSPQDIRPPDRLKRYSPSFLHRHPLHRVRRGVEAGFDGLLELRVLCQLTEHASHGRLQGEGPLRLNRCLSL
jgi:hypothetical protein